MNRNKYMLVALVCVAITAVTAAVSTHRSPKEDQADGTVSIADESINDNDPEKTYLFDTKGGESFGMVKRIYADNVYIQTIDATLPIKNDGLPYQVWIENNAGESVCLGDIAHIDGSFVFVYQTNKDLMDYKKVYITPTSDKTRILEGTF